METRPAEHLILESGKSEELRQALGLVQDAQAPDGSPRYSGAACRALARMIVCRTYAKPMLELVHLILAVTQASPDRRYETFLWGLDKATSAGFRGQFTAYLGPDHVMLNSNDDGVTVTMGDGTFLVTYSRMPVLAALLEFLMTVLGYRDLDDAIGEITTGAISSKQAGEAANGLARSLYAYLKDNLPTVQTQRRNRSFMEYLAEKNGGMMVADAVNDTAVFEYWRAMAHTKDSSLGDAPSSSEGQVDAQIDAKTFSGVFMMALRLAKMLRAAADRLAVGEARPIGTDREAGEVDPGEIEGLLTAVEESGNLLSPLGEMPVNGIKFLTKREQDGLSDLAHNDDVGRQFPLSVLRNAVFGRGQAKITNALRQGSGGNDLDITIARAAEHDYATQFEVYKELTTQLERMLLASYHVLLSAKRAEVVDLVLQLEPGLDLTELRDTKNKCTTDDGAVVSLAEHRALSDFFDLAGKGEGPFLALNQRAKAATKGMTRRGFSTQDRTDPTTIDGFSQGFPALLKLRNAVNRYVDAELPARDWSAQFAQDRHMFTDTFKLLYDQAPDGVRHA